MDTFTDERFLLKIRFTDRSFIGKLYPVCQLVILLFYRLMPVVNLVLWYSF